MLALVWALAGSPAASAPAPGGPTKAETDACGSSPTSFCLHVLHITGSKWLAGGSEIILRLFHILIVVIAALVLRALAGRLIRRTVRSTAEGRVNRQIERIGHVVIDMSPAAVARRRARATTIGSVLSSITNVVISTIAAIIIVGELGINLAPIIASAGIVGVAVGFGAQNLVKDFLSGLFLVLEDQYGVGDHVKIGDVEGVVETVGLRSTRIRSDDGTLWHIRNGEVVTVGNHTQRTVDPEAA
ncbi:MAG TPA: mechanosensitive ion channel domain-containing protein [Mycobacteriales bacterium]|nr:mechanosensitive ion channel domain-containing protein [Mycobacteriales bacterium]